ncbi:hypothetical protein OEZ85_004725 [Tetradesmus obliquus]|uniref:Uncharacterized protein n=1 Tax=Tetradesmus obliquus TaxID=3088 RepID=A0ABY8ULT8_TETOB|nr:hypothetical protein OEZ85_004725 [Tetradesmus obliquus]
MSFVLHGLHEQQQHANYLVYNFEDGRTICLACFLHSLSDPGQLDSKKQFAVREFMAMFDPEGPEGARLLHVLLSQHAALLVAGLLSAFNSTHDLGVSMALQDTALMMASCAPNYLPELFTER